MHYGNTLTPQDYKDNIRFYKHKSSETIRISELLSYHPSINFTCLARSGLRLIFSWAIMNWSTSARASSVHWKEEDHDKVIKMGKELEKRKNM